MDEAFERKYWDNYYDTVNHETGAHPLGPTIDRLARAIASHTGKDQARTREVVESEILNSPSPEDLRPEAIDLIAHALEADMPVYIWTVGDHGPTTDPTTGKPYPVYNFQLAKIEKSLLKSKLQEASPLLAQDPTKLDKLLVHIAPEGKINELSTIFKSLAFEGITEAYLADDKQKNISDAQQLAETIPQLHLHNWRVNNGPSPEDHNGDFAHFAAEANTWLEQLKQENKRGALILDWDDTVYNEQQRIKRKIKNTYSALY